MGCTYLDKDGEMKPIIMGSYGIGSGRLLACIAEEHHDGDGIIWPITVAPYAVHLVSLPGKSGESEVISLADRLYLELRAKGIDVIYDDRQESAGVKFTDADLLGMPIRLTVSERSIKSGGVEIKRRDQADKRVVPYDQVYSVVGEEIAALRSDIQAKVVPMPYEE